MFEFVRNDNKRLKAEVESTFDMTGYEAEITIKNKNTNEVVFTDTKTLSEEGALYICVFDTCTFTTAGDYVFDIEVTGGVDYKDTPINNALIQIKKDVNNK